MSARKIPGFGDRMKFLRGALGAFGPALKLNGDPATSIRQFGQELGFAGDGQAYRTREDGSFPAGGLRELAAGFSRLKRVQERGLDPMALAIWAETGVGEAPIHPPAVKTERPHQESPEDQGDEPPPSGGGVGLTREGAEVVVPAMPLNLVMRLSRFVNRAAAQALNDVEGRADLDALEISAAFKRWFRSLPQEDRAKLIHASGAGGGASESLSNLLKSRRGPLHARQIHHTLRVAENAA